MTRQQNFVQALGHYGNSKEDIEFEDARVQKAGSAELKSRRVLEEEVQIIHEKRRLLPFLI